MLLPVWLLTADAKGVVVNQEVYNVHDVTGTMKQFFRNLPDPLLTHHLYDQFIEAAREWSVKGWERRVCWWMACVCVGVLQWMVCGGCASTHTHTYVCMWRAWCVTR